MADLRSQEIGGPTLVDCGCKARVHGDGSGIEIDYCNVHAAAPAMLTVLESIRDLINDAEDKKVRTGRLPPVADLLSEIRDSAQSVIDEARP